MRNHFGPAPVVPLQPDEKIANTSAAAGKMPFEARMT